ncbi:MAG: tetratricopeptide repeat protein [Saprospiraceae bacterium]|nr:tetratricopeptide repeat protein [Saprospiraceae bacterium]
MTEPKPFLNRKFISGLLIVLMIAGAAASVWWYTTRSASSDLFHALPTATEAEVQDPAWTQAKEAYQQGTYPEAINLLEAHLAGHPDHTEAWFLLGLSCLETGEEERTIQIMDEVRLNDPLYYADATWYMGLACLKQDDTNRARLLMGELDNGPDSLFQAKANLVIQRFL